MDMPTVAEAAHRIRNGEESALRLTQRCLDAVSDANPNLNAFVYVDSEGALAAAEAVDSSVVAGRGDELGPLAGVPFGVKDLEDCAGMPTTRGSRWFADTPSKTVDSIHVARLRAAGAIPIGKTATPEFGAWALHRQSVARRDPQPVEPEPHPGWIERRVERGGVGGHGPVLHGERWRWLDPHPGRLYRPGRSAGDLRAHSDVRRYAPGAERGGRLS